MNGLARTDQNNVKVGNFPLPTVIEQQLWKSGELAKVANILFPATALDQLPPMHKPSLSVIMVNTDPASKETYPLPGGQLGLSKCVIEKIFNAAGGNVRTEKLTPDSDLDHIRYRAIVWGKLPDGTLFTSTGTKSWSWEKCQQEMSAQQAKQYRQFADEQTETKAMLRAARKYLNLKTSYSKEELQKPFLIARSVPDLDMSDPVIKQMYAQRLIDSTYALYGGSEAPALPPMSIPEPSALPSPDEYEDDDVIDGADTPQVTQVIAAEPVDDSYDPFPTDEEPGEALLTEEQLDAELKKLAGDPTKGGIGGAKFIELLKGTIGSTRLTGIPFDVKRDIYEKAIAIKNGGQS